MFRLYEEIKENVRLTKVVEKVRPNTKVKEKVGLNKKESEKVSGKFLCMMNYFLWILISRCML